MSLVTSLIVMILFCFYFSGFSKSAVTSLIVMILFCFILVDFQSLQ